jgi:hypothetical protein
VAAVVDDDHRAEDWDAAYGMATNSMIIPSAGVACLWGSSKGNRQAHRQDDSHP